MKINLINLHEGVNDLHFQVKPIDLGFDEDAEMLSLFPNDIHVTGEIQKFSDKYFIKVELQTHAHFACDRCLEDFDQKIDGNFKLIYSKQTRDKFAETDDYRILGDKTTEIDLSSDIRENLLLTLPMKHLCKDDCRGLCAQCGANLNSEICNCKQEDIDPRWEKLKRLK